MILFCQYSFKPDNDNNNNREEPFKIRKPGSRKDGNALASLVQNISFKSDESKKRNIAQEISKVGKGNIAAQIFKFRELAAATKNFKAESLEGEGGFGRVYKVVAVKQLDRNGLQGNREFIVEVLMLSLLHNENLVNLIGYCADGDQRILVYECMPFGSGRSPSWMKIAGGATKGLEYLHDTANPPVIYRDFKASNILLDEVLNLKLSDFGLAKLGPTGDKSYVSARVMGTYGYRAPEYALTEEAGTQPLISDAVTTLEYLAMPQIEEWSAKGTPPNTYPLKRKGSGHIEI
ncbi:hypothetical protein GIB67_017752 [Kingdonia uniflora]|uniref:Protein kinase domain-containing protein n=1 Tax=Kingdonia uniflora TaxID=39325 RepID=A0A7J7LQ17_9MAGN|nr:hypothetical protein GIB67_017752 [Kingdonia uniflora]